MRTYAFAKVGTICRHAAYINQNLRILDSRCDYSTNYAEISTRKLS